MKAWGLASQWQEVEAGGRGKGEAGLQIMIGMFALQSYFELTDNNNNAGNLVTD